MRNGMHAQRPDQPTPYRPTPAEEAELFRLLDAKLASFEPAYRTPRQVLGRRSTAGCVALEVTQRCNLDCTLCYLSDYSESVPDPPLDELKRKADNVKRIFGVQTNVQITGGDPTLRRRDELVEIVRYVAAIGLNPALFTNGIKATRDLLAELREVGLVDVAFHVDITQERKGFTNERQLNSIREEYLERARGLGLAVIFNTTVCDQNLDEIPELVRFFVGKAGELGMCSFQMQADTGRGILHKRGQALTKQQMQRIIDEACGTPLSWDHVLIGHPECHNIAYALVVGGRAVLDLFDDARVVERFLGDFGTVPLDRSDVPRSALAVARHIFTTRPEWLGFGGAFAARLVLRIARAMVATRSMRVGKLSFFMQNFQDADQLDRTRLHHCSFYVATRDGAVSMCEHNAQRDDYIIPPNLVRGVDIKPSRPPIAAVPRDASHRPIRRADS
jgi:7,8-dihydro-6-hydroxymethylpterin dimethyltransferase